MSYRAFIRAGGRFRRPPFWGTVWQAIKDAAHRWYVVDFAEWMDRRGIR